jgi:hypothetical protein
MVEALFILEKQKSFVLYINLYYQMVFIKICYLYSQNHNLLHFKYSNQIELTYFILLKINAITSLL